MSAPIQPTKSAACGINFAKARRNQAFSLVEVVMALAVFSFAMVSMMALIPTGLKAYQTASNSTAFAAIVQNVTTDVELIGMTNITYTSTNYYFDSQGSMTSQGSASQVYTAQVKFSPVGSQGSGTGCGVLDPLSSTAGLKIAVAVTNKSQSLSTNYFSTILAY